MYEYLSDDVGKWQSLIELIKQSCSFVKQCQGQNRIGCVVIDQTVVQQKVIVKYEFWHRELIDQFGESLHMKMREFFNHVTLGKQRLEAIDFRSQAADIMQFITEIKLQNERKEQWEHEMEKNRQGNQLLGDDSNDFHSDWLCFSQVEGLWNGYCQILEKKTA